MFLKGALFQTHIRLQPKVWFRPVRLTDDLVSDYKKSHSEDTEKKRQRGPIQCLLHEAVTHTPPYTPHARPTNTLAHKQHMVRFQVELRPDRCTVRVP